MTFQRLGEIAVIGVKSGQLATVDDAMTAALLTELRIDGDLATPMVSVAPTQQDIPDR